MSIFHALVGLPPICQNTWSNLSLIWIKGSSCFKILSLVGCLHMFPFFKLGELWNLVRYYFTSCDDSFSKYWIFVPSVTGLDRYLRIHSTQTRQLLASVQFLFCAHFFLCFERTSESVSFIFTLDCGTRCDHLKMVHSYLKLQDQMETSVLLTPCSNSKTCSFSYHERDLVNNITAFASDEYWKCSLLKIHCFLGVFTQISVHFCRCFWNNNLFRCFLMLELRGQSRKFLHFQVCPLPPTTKIKL